MRAAQMSSQTLRFKGFGLSLALAAIFMVSACHQTPKTEEKAGGQEAMVDYALASEQTAPVLITGSGTIGAWQEAPIGAEVGGLTATAVLADEGQYVEKGQPLLTMNDAVLKAQYSQAEAGVMSAQAQANEAQRAYQRSKELFDKGYFSQAALDQKEAAYKSAQASVATAEAARQEVGTRLSQATVRAPVSGLITSRTAVTGQIVDPGVELFRIVRDNRIEMNMEVVESELALLKAGMEATVTSEMGETVTGTIRVVTPVVNQGTRLGYARISIPANVGFKPGQFARAAINVGNQNVVVVPLKAVIYQQNLPVAFVLGADNKVSARKVKTGDRVGENIVITDGIKTGDRVITAGAGFLADGDKVRLAKAPKAAVKTGGE